MSNTARMGILVGGGPAPGINSAIGAAVVAVGAMAVASEPQAKATSEPPATKANGLRKPVGTSCRRESYWWWTRIISPPKGKISVETDGYPE
jgi:hypothetical protein